VRDVVALAVPDGYQKIWRDAEARRDDGGHPEGTALQALAAYVRIAGAINRIFGEVLSWLALAVVLVCFTVVVQRYLFHVSYPALQDLYVWLSGAMFTGVAGFALMRGDHVRVDIFYRPWPIRRKAVADLIGSLLFLMPFVIVTFIYALPNVSRSWRLFEGSANVGGMPGFFVLKSFVLLFCVLVGLQGLAMAARSILVLGGRENLLPPGQRYHAEEEGVHDGL
jgi:TRAP-type mannitol/chloroaromatic compound transport system permease small subunit